MIGILLGLMRDEFCGHHNHFGRDRGYESQFLYTFLYPFSFPLREESAL